MFTGIIAGVGTIVKKKANSSGLSLTIETNDIAKDLKKGSSIAVNGACLTVKEIEKSAISFDIMNETIKKTTLNYKKVGDRVNLEPALRVGDELGGHFVYGHADGVGEIISVEDIGNDRLLTIKPPKDLEKYIVPQGSIAIDGVSLTVAKLSGTTFTVSLIPFTLENTILGELKAGDKVNLENDMLAKASLKS